MNMAIGQRWLYDWGGYVFLLEVISVSPPKSLVVQANEYAKTRDYVPGKREVSWRLDQENSCHHLPGQEKPQ